VEMQHQLEDRTAADVMELCGDDFRSGHGSSL
jgi:hypothetical protein